MNASSRLRGFRSENASDVERFPDALDDRFRSSRYEAATQFQEFDGQALVVLDIPLAGSGMETRDAARVEAERGAVRAERRRIAAGHSTE